MRVNLEQSEINHLLSLLKKNEDDREYYATEKQYWDRHKNIKNKLEFIQKSE